MVDDHGPADAFHAPHIVRTVDAEFVQELIVSMIPEDQRLEYKRTAPTSWSDKDSSELRKDVVAMANGGGGIIVYGIGENKDGHADSVHTTPDHNTVCTRMESVLAACIDPPLQRISIEPLAVQNKTVIVVQVEQHEVLPHCVEHGAANRRFPVRQGRLVRAMTMQEIRHKIQGDRTASGSSVQADPFVRDGGQEFAQQASAIAKEWLVY